jgi:hypothetical protein
VNLIQANVIFLSVLSLAVFLFIMRKLVKGKAPGFMWLIAIYLFFIFFQLLFGYGCYLLFPDLRGKKSLINLSAHIFVITEYFTFACLLYKFIHLPPVKIYLITSCIPFTITAILLWYSGLSYPKVNSIIIAIESLSIVPCCLYYIFELLNDPYFPRLTNQPSFWVTTGILFLFVSITPLYIAFDYLRKVPEMQVLDFFGYDLLVVFFAKANATKPNDAIKKGVPISVGIPQNFALDQSAVKNF